MDEKSKSESKPSGGLVRISLLIACLAIVSGYFIAHRVHAELGERSLAVGRELERLPRDLAGTTILRVNGQEFALNSSEVERGVDDMLDRFSKLCAKSSGGMQKDIAEAIARGAKLPAKADEFGVFRTARGEPAGTAACFAREGEGGAQALLRDLGEAFTSGDLSKIGQFRYAYARRGERPNTTHVITVWSRGPLAPELMFPAEGDAPGSDLVEGARPRGAKRVLSAKGVNNTYQAVIYESDGELATALESYEQSLAQRGYVPMVDRKRMASMPVTARVFQRASDEQDELAVIADQHDGKTLLAGFRLGTRGSLTLHL